MSFSTISTFALTSLVLALAPGPDNIFVLTQSALYGVKRGILIILGLCLGIMIQTLCLIIGISAFIATTPVLIIAIKVLGALYLSYLSYLAIKASIKLKGQTKVSIDSDLKNFESANNLSNSKLVLHGLIMNITNPKVQLFFLSFFPQFLPTDTQGLSLALSIALLGSIFTFATLIVFGSIAVFSGTLSSYFSSPIFNIRLNYCAALIFISLAIYTLISL